MINHSFRVFLEVGDVLLQIFKFKSELFTILINFEREKNNSENGEENLCYGFLFLYLKNSG